MSTPALLEIRHARWLRFLDGRMWARRFSPDPDMTDTVRGTDA